MRRPSSSRRKSSRSEETSFAWRIVEAIPLALPAALAAFSVVAVLLLIMGQLSSTLTFGVGGAAALMAAYAVVRFSRTTRPGSQKEQRIVDVLVIIGAIVWLGFNILYTSQHVVTDRDPATYGVAGVWLINHDNLDIHYSPEFQDLEGTSQWSAGFAVDKDYPDRIYAQGQHLLPTLLGLGGRIVGDQHLFHIAPLFGMTALLAIYAFARLLVRPRWALVATAVIAVSLPLIYFSRDNYTEPLAATFTFSALALILVAQKTKRLILWGIAGIVAGAGALTRVDAYLMIATLVLFAALYVVLAKKTERRAKLQHVGTFGLGLAVPAIVGWLDVSLLSPLYFRDIYPMLKQEIWAICTALVVGGGLIIVGWRTSVLTWLDRHTKKWRGLAIFIGILLLATIIISRPLWYTSYVSVQNELIAGLQMAAGDPVEPRNYAEQTAQWVAWYIGPFMGILGVIGLAWAASRAVMQRELFLLASVVVVGFTSIVYFILPNITADQIWAIRRFVPVIIPGLVIFGVYALDQLALKWRLSSVKQGAITGIIAILLIAVPLQVSMPLLHVRERKQLASINAVCQSIPKNAAVLWVGIARNELLMTTRAFCGDVPVAGYVSDEIDKESLVNIAESVEQNGKQLVVGVYRTQMAIMHNYGFTEGDMTLVNENEYKVIEQKLHGPPQETYLREDVIYMGKVSSAEGIITPLE